MGLDLEGEGQGEMLPFSRELVLQRAGSGEDSHLFLAVVCFPRIPSASSDVSGVQRV